MKNSMTITAFALSVMLSGAAFAETVKPVDAAKPAKVDTITTQSIGEAVDATQCGKTVDGDKTMKFCGDGSAYPANPMSGMALGF